MKMFKWFRNLFLTDWENHKIEMKLSVPCCPPDNLTHSEAINKYPMQGKRDRHGCLPIMYAPLFCTECRSDIKIKESDWWNIEDSGQYMVTCYYCPNGCGHYCTWA